MSTGAPADALRIAQVGLGEITVHHRAGYRIYGQPVVGGYDPEPAAVQRLLYDTPDARVYSSVDELLADPNVGVIDLATPHHRGTRLPVLERIAASGKPVLIQKPLAMTYADALEIAGLFQRHGGVGMVNQNMCFTPSAHVLETAMLRDGLIGEPSFGHVRMQFVFDTGHHPWFGRDERWWTVGLTVHHLGLLHLLLGPPRQVFALLGRDAGQPGVTTEGYGHLSLVYRSGLHVSVVSTGTYYGTSPVHHCDEEVWFQGSGGLLDWRPQGDVVLSRRGSGGDVTRTALEVPERRAWFPDAFGLTMAHLREAVADGRVPLCSVEDNLYVMAVIEAAYRSAAEKRAIRLEEIMGDRYDDAYGPGWWHGFDTWEPPLPAADTSAADVPEGVSA